MKALGCVLLLCFGGLSCARIYRPVTLVAPPPVATQSQGLSGALTAQPWGDNSRYKERALRANLRVVALSFENRSSDEVEVLRLELPEGVEALTPEAALKLVRQHTLAYLLYPILPTLLTLGAAPAEPGAFISNRMIFQAFAVAGFLVGLPNALVAANSNLRIGTFFQEQAWSPGVLAPGQARRGLVFLRSPDTRAPLQIRVITRSGAGERSLELTTPAATPL